MSRLLYFAYGSNLDEEQMRERCPGARVRFRAELPLHRLDFTHYSTRWAGGAADVLPCSDASVWGMVYELSPHNLALLDRYESGYDRIEIEVRDDASAAHRLLTYSVRDKGRHLPSAHYLGKIVHWAEHWSFPPEYLEFLRGLAARPDPA